MIILRKDEKYKLSLITITLLTLQSYMKCLLRTCCLHHAFYNLFETQRFLQYLRYVRSFFTEVFTPSSLAFLLINFHSALGIYSEIVTGQIPPIYLFAVNQNQEVHQILALIGMSMCTLSLYIVLQHRTYINQHLHIISLNPERYCYLCIVVQK